MRINNLLNIGLDTLEIKLISNVILSQTVYYFKNPKGIEIGRLKSIANGYKLSICLPKIIRKDNIIPFNTNDYKYLSAILGHIEKYLYDLFGNHFPEMIVSNCEVNCTIALSDKSKTAPLLSLLAHILLTTEEKLFITCSGEKRGKRYSAVKNLCSGKRIESIKTPILSNSRFCFKIYDKGLEGNISDKGLIRIEFCYTKRGLKYAKTGKSLCDFLSPDSINSLLLCYKKDYKTYFIDRYWNNRDIKSLDDEYSVPIYKEIITIIYNDLVSHQGQPLTVALMNKNYVEMDFDLFRKACNMYYKNKDSSRKACYRIRNSGELQINTGIIKEFVSFSKQIIYG